MSQVMVEIPKGIKFCVGRGTYRDKAPLKLVQLFHPEWLETAPVKAEEPKKTTKKK